MIILYKVNCANVFFYVLDIQHYTTVINLYKMTSNSSGFSKSSLNNKEVLVFMFQICLLL